MFKWRSERNKITAVFKLQFHITQVSEFGGNGLVLSVVPAENGRPTAKLEKCVMRENGCYWENPIYETVKFFQDPKTGKFQDRIYYFIISAGSPRGSLVGEFSVNIADYVAATKACAASFPFKNKPECHLHVSIQRVQGDSYQRVFEENGSPKIMPDDRSLRRHFSNGDVEGGVKASAVEDESLRKTVSQLPGYNGTRRGSSGSDITLSSSDSSSGLNTPRELGMRSNYSNGDQSLNGSTYHQDEQRRWELAIVPVNGSSTEQSMNSPRYGFSIERSLMGSDDSVEKLKSDIVALSRRAEVSELELQTLRKQIVKESKKGQDLLREITSLKEERDALKDECEKFKSSRKHADDMKARSKFEGDPSTLLEEIREELNYEKDLNANLRLQLQKTQESNAELLLAVQDLEEMLEKNHRGGSVLPNRSASDESAVETEEGILRCASDDEEQKALEELVRQHSDAQEAYLLEQKIMDLCSEIEMYRRDKDDLEIQMEQLALDYEILKQENHEYCCKLEQCHLQEQLKPQHECSSSCAVIKELQGQRENLENELREKSEELSHCSTTIKGLEARNQRLERELEKQAEGFAVDKEALSRAQVEQEERAARAEEALTLSNTTNGELRIQLEKMNMKLKQCFEELSNSFATIKELEFHKHSLEEELQKQAQGFDAEMGALTNAKMEQEQRTRTAEEAVARSNATISELENRIKKLESELENHSVESSDNLNRMKELEKHIQNLEEELEKQAEGFEADLDAVTCAKVEREQRAIRAEEALRLVRWKNANTAARIQDEFKRLSSQMQSSFEANERLASKALTEASELRMENRHLQDTLQKANEELQSSKEEYETKLQELNNEISLKTDQLEDQKKRAGEVQKDISAEKLEVQAEIERLTRENKSLTEETKEGARLRSELENLKALIKEREGERMERYDTEGAISAMREAEGKSREELKELRRLKDEKDQMVEKMKSEVETLRVRCDMLKNSLYEDESEKEKLRKQVIQLKSDLKKKDEAILNIEKKFKESNGRGVAQDRSKASSKATKPEPVQRGSKEAGSKEVAVLKERIKLLEEQLKSKDVTLETSANAFLSKEKDLQGKIEELEIRLGEACQSHPGPRQDKITEEKVSVGMQVECDAEEATTTDGISDMNLRDSEAQTLSETQADVSSSDSGDQQKFDILLKETVLLKERNNAMENELKEMQERYSEISLKFAEVEGERQQLVMSLRNLKNAKKS